MKKGLILFFALLLLAPFFSFVDAQGSDPSAAVKDVVGFDPSKLPNPENIDDIKTEYMKKEWYLILKDKPVIGPIIIVFNKVLTALSPAFVKILGVGYSFSWAFIFAVCFWLALFLLLTPITSQLFGSTPLGILGGFILASLVGLTGVIRKAVDTMVFAITNWWIATASLIVAIIILVICPMLGKEIKKYIAQQKEAAAKEKTARDRALLATDADIAKKDLDGYKQGGK